MNNKLWFILCVLYGIGLSACARYFDFPTEVRLAAILASVFIIVIGGPIGLLVGHFLAKDADVDSNGFKIIAWSGLIGWVIPVVGATIASMVYMFWRKSTFHQGFYNNMGNIVGLLAVTNAMVGGGWAAYEGMAVKQAKASISPSAFETMLERRGIDPQDLTGERSTARCQYAALEGWSRDEVRRYC